MYIRLKYESFHSEAPFSPYLHVLILQSCFAFRLLFGRQLFHTVFQTGCSSWDRAVEYISLILFLFFPLFFFFGDRLPKKCFTASPDTRSVHQESLKTAALFWFPMARILLFFGTALFSGLEKHFFFFLHRLRAAGRLGLESAVPSKCDCMFFSDCERGKVYLLRGATVRVHPH